MFRTLITAAIAMSLAVPALAADKPYRAKITVVFDHVLPNIPGKSLRGVLVEYGPGGSNSSHTHAKSAFIYATVLEGRIKSAVNDGKPTIYKAGEHWIESPGDHHKISANASDTDPAKLLAVFVVDTKETELTTPDK